MKPIAAAVDTFTSITDRLEVRIPEILLVDPETARRARLISRFGLMGSIFGLIYASFYLLIGHDWGAVIVVLCTLGVAATPLLMLWRKATEPAGHFLAFTLTLGFFCLCFVEGGVRGHAIAWLVSVPLCALLLLGARAAAVWVGIAFLAASFVVGCDFAGWTIIKTYDPKWESLVSAAGYLGLVLFMSMLGLIFERGRSTAHRRMQAALKNLGDSNERLVALNEEKSEFLGIAAHDLKNPLSVIMAQGDMIKVIKNPEQLHLMADMIISASERMHDLIKNLLDANAIEEGRFASKIESCDINPIVSRMVEQNRFHAEKKKIDMRLGVCDLLMVRTDAGATQQILDNLISNAVKYSPANSTIHVHVMPEKDHALVLVRDEGPGISEDDQKKLFQKFCRLTARPTGGESSTGLGLSIAKRLAQNLGGDILCRSALGAGTTFTLRLPLRGIETVRPQTAHNVEEILREKATFTSHRN